jgi:HSP20 family protein
MDLVFENGFTGNGWLFDRMHGLTREMNGAPRSFKPLADIVEDKDTYRFYLEVPGLNSQSIDVQVENEVLTISAERKHPEWAEDARLHLAERGYGRMKRAFELPEDASAEQVHAAYKDGVLEITIQKRPEKKPVKIQIN